MDCSDIPDLSYNDFGTRLRQKIGNQRIPIKGSLELNFRCNLRCKHCYVAHGHTGIPGMQELSTGEVMRVLDEITDEGCLYLLLTGGEPMMRRDFKEIYLYAKRKGLLLTLFTNGTMITPDLADFLAEYRPFNLEISLYGFSQETHEAVTGIRGSHRRCYQGIELLVERDIILGLKTIIMTLNQHEFFQMKAYAESLGVNFRFDGMINSGLDGSGRPLDLRLSPQELIQVESGQEKFHEAWANYRQRIKENAKPNNQVYTCGAGISSFHIDPYGQLSLCLMARNASYDLRQGSFKEGWWDFLQQERFQEMDQPSICSQCELKPVCTSCPGWSQMEHGVNGKPVGFLCQVASQRARVLENQDIIAFV